MVEKNSKRILTCIKQLILEEHKNKFRTEPLKNIMDFLFRIFEKVGGNYQIVSNSYIQMYDSLVKKEIHMASISKNNHVLVIGCGSIPATSIIIARETNAHIDAIDNDLKAVQRAHQYVSMYGVQNTMTIHYGDGVEYPVKKYDIIIVVYGVKPLPQLLTNLFNNMHETARIILRVPSDMERKIQTGENQISNLFHVEDVVKTPSFGYTVSLLLSKKKKIL